MKDLRKQDPALSGLLRQWDVASALPVGFQEQVWRRIARRQARAGVRWWTPVMAWIEASARRPAFAVSYVLILLALGLLAGYWQAQEDTARWETSLGSRYVQLLDPYQAPRH